MIRSHIALASLVVSAVALCACPASTTSAGEGEGEGGEGEGEGDVDGFPLRTPGTTSVSCDPDPTFCPGGHADVAQIDIACTLHVGGRDDVVYVQSTPTGVDGLGDGVYGDVHAYVLDNGITSEVTGNYDFGGQHHNDFFTVTLDEPLRFNHSSFGFGGRACQAPDCVQRLDGPDVVEDGCTPARSLPEACAYVTDGTLPTLTPDPFAKCPGDPN